MSEQQQIEATLRQSEEHFRRLTKLSPVPVVIINLWGDIEYLNDRFLTTFGYNLDDIPNMEAWWRCAYPDEHHRLKGIANWRQAVEKAEREHTDIEPSESRVTCKDGTVRIAEIIGTRIGSKNLVILQDITERKRAEEEIVRQSGQLRALAARLADVEETGREHLARELHDQVCQSLTALSLTLTLLQTQMPRKAAAKLLGRMAGAVALVEQIGETIRDVMAELRPPMLDDYGLLSALHWYGTEFSDKTGIDVDVQGQEAVPRLAAPVELALFRIVQEAMANVAKHAQATEDTPHRGGGQRHGSPGHRRQRRRFRPGAAGPAGGPPPLGPHDHERAGRGGRRPLPHRVPARPGHPGGGGGEPVSLPVFLADGQAVVQNGLKPWSEKSLVAPVSYRCGCTG